MTEQPPLRAGAAVSEAALSRIFTGVVARTLPKAEWTHQAHLAYGCALIDALGLARAENAVRGHISAYNEACGVVNDDAGGYHHTLSIFYLRAIAAQPRGPGEPCAAFAARVLASPLADAAYPLRFYSRERLFSREARRDFVPPDHADAPFARAADA